MNTLIQNSHVITVTTPAGRIESGDGLIIGNIFGVTAYSAAVGDPLELTKIGASLLPKATGAVLTVGVRVAVRPQSWACSASQAN